MADVSFVCSVNLGCCTGSDAGVLISISRGPTLKHGSINTERETHWEGELNYGTKK